MVNYLLFCDPWLKMSSSIHPILYQDCILLLLMPSTHCCGRWRGKKKRALECHLHVADVRFSALDDRGTIQRQKGKKSIRQLGGIPPHWSVRVRREKCILGTTWFCTEQENYLLPAPPPSPYAAFKIPPSWLERTRIWRYSCVWSPGLSETSSCFVFVTWCSKKWNPRWLIR